MAMSFPECIYAIGGAGKELIFNMLKQEWILKEILRPDHNPNKCTVIIIDTCLEDENEDKRAIGEIKEKISKITEDYIDSRLDTGLNVGEIKVAYHLLTRELLLESPVDLGGRGVKDTVLNATDAECWWINDNQISEDWYQKIKSRENLQNLDFAKGVYRKRAIAKAIYYKALSENKFKVEVSGRNIDIICGLGGGTGSGIALSLAKKIKLEKPASDIHLFGIISTLRESYEEKANCAAMLSELEYMKVVDNGSEIHKDGIDFSENNVFRNIVLLPIEPTEYGGEQTLNSRLQKQIMEYDDVFPYVLIAFHNTPGGQPAFLDSRSFAPFSIAIPQLIRYNVNYIKQIKDSLSEKILAKDKSLDSEIKIYELVSSFLARNYDSDFKDIKTKNLLDEDAIFVQERYEQFKIVLNFKYFDELQYKNVLELKKIVNKIDRRELDENESSSIKIEQIIKNIQSEIEGEGLDDMAKASTDIDYSTYKVLVNDLVRISSLIKIIKEINTLNDDLIKRTLKSCVKPQKDETLGIRLKKTKDAIDSAEEEKGHLSREFQDLGKAYAEFKEKIEENANSRDKNWKSNSRAIFNKMSEIEKAKTDLIDSFESVQAWTEKYIKEINEVEKESKIKEIDANKIEKKFSEFFKKMDFYTLDYSEIKELKKFDDVFSRIKEIKLADIKSKKKLPVMDKVVPGETKAKMEKREAKKLRDRLLVDLNTIEHIKFSDGKFSFRFNYDIKEKIDDKLDEYIELTLKELKKDYFNRDTEALFENLILELKDPNARENINIEEIVKTYSNFNEGLKKREELVSKKSAELEAISIKIEKYKDLESLMRNIVKHYNNHLSYLSDYNSYFSETDKWNESKRYLLGEDLFVKEIQPKEIFQILASQSDINRVIRDEREKQFLVKEVKNSFSKISSKRYNALAVKSFSTEEVRWEWTKLGCVMITKAKGIEKEVFDGISTDLVKEFCITNYRFFNNWVVPYGDDWGVGIVTFISPIPLDNINNFVDVMEGYFQAYQKMKKDPDKLSILHNSLLLEKGKYVERGKVFDLENSEETKRQFLEDEKKTKELIASNLEVKNLSDIAKTIK
jgi:hypothetical protein